jgi:hypothetical protein
VCTENLVRIDLMRESLNVGHDSRADISLRAGIYKDRANKANVKIGQRKCHITCAFRKSCPDVLMMQSGQDWDGDNDTGPLDCSMQGRIFL